jgi:hypothetical protein
MLEELRSFRRICPMWLRSLPETLAMPILHENLTPLLRNTLVYPGSGTDWSPIRQTIGVVHSYLFFECHTERERVESLLRSCAPVRSQAHVRCLGVFQFDTRELSLEVHALDCHRFPERNNMLEGHDEGYGLWAVYETPMHGRVSVLVLQQEAIQGIAKLHLATRSSPQVLVLQDHGFGRNCWRSFGEPYHCLISQLGLAWPEILIVGLDDYGFRHKENYRTICTDVATEAMHGNQRDVCVRGSANRVGGRIDLLPPTPPSKRVRTRRFW